MIPGIKKAMRAKIKDIAYYLPERVVTNADLAKAHPAWDMKTVEGSVGVKKRHIARNNETALDLSFRACQKLLRRNKNLRERVDGIIFCTQSEDHIMPPNSCILHKWLNLSEDVFAFDFNLACSGYIYGLALAQSLILSNTAKNILLVNADTYSKYIHPGERSTVTLFGDGAAVSWITGSHSKQGILDIKCATYGKHFDKFIIRAGCCRMPKSEKTAVPMIDKSGNVRTLENIHMNGMEILAFVNSKIPQQIKWILSKNELKIADIDLFVFHQASKLVLDSLMRTLNIPWEKTHINLQDVGNMVSASIPVVLKDALDRGKVSRGDRILLCGFGAGLSWGTVIITV